MLANLARFSYRRRWIMVFAIWLPLLVVINAVSGAVGSDYHTSFTLPDSQSKTVQDALIKAGSKEDSGFNAQIVFRADQGTADPAVKAAMEALFVKVDALEGVKVTSPYAPAGKPFNSATQPISFAQMAITSDRTEAQLRDLAKHIRSLGDEVKVPGLRVEYGGEIFNEFEFPASELLGILAAILILLVAFGSVLAMGLPIGTALFGLGVSMGGVALVSRLHEMPSFSPQMAAMIGIGVGIDYALFIVTRYREHLHAGDSVEDSIVAAVDTSGRAVVFAGITVMISLLGLMVVGLAFVRGLAIAGSLAVLVMMLAAITLVPALLGFVGRRIDNTSRAAAISVAVFVVLALAGVLTGLPLGAALLGALAIAVVVMVASLLPFGKALRIALAHRHTKPREQQFWWRWSRFIQHRPWVGFIGGVAVMVLLALPVFAIRMGFSDNGNLAEKQTARRAYDMLAEGFGPGFNGPLVMVSTEPGVTQADANSITTVVGGDPNIAFISQPIPLSDGAFMWQAFAKTSPQDKATTDLVHRLRSDVLPATGHDVVVGGTTAIGVDFANFLAQRLKLLIGAVLVLSFLLLMVVFRSVLVPLKAVAMNLLSVGAAYGVIVAIFQWGWLKDVFGIGAPGPIEAWVPMMLFAITFGLSMDYEVFLLSRMKEEYDRTGDNATAVADGLAVTARVITAAALIMVCVFAAFVLGEDRQLKLFGLGLAVAVLVDATIVRMILVPSTMELLGARNWWMPKWLDRVLPRINVEGGRDHVTPTTAGTLP